MELDFQNTGSDIAFSNPSVFFNLGIAYATGKGVEWDLVAAHKWFNIAASLGHREAIAYRRDLANEMLPAQISEAQRQARTWFASRQSKPPAVKPAPEIKPIECERNKSRAKNPPRTVKRRRGKINLAFAAI